jgi:DNA-binding transcriptional ArsR family regulator
MKTLNLNSEELQTAASMMKVLGHPIRISIIELLDDTSKMSVTEIF